ncbi:MAG: GNAT family N-acetyltransferase [Clostridiales bacterium]|nr:GNAT family N-acetyltransferase [Clostridiales bacterium]
MKVILETRRLYLRELTEADFTDLCDMLRDEACMYAYEHAFSKEESTAWLQRQLERYKRDGIGLWAVIRKADGVFLGQCGLTLQQVGAPLSYYDNRAGAGERREAKTARAPVEASVGVAAESREPLPLIQPAHGEELEIGYLMKRKFWRQGYATEAAAGCRDHAFETLCAPRVASIIRDNNLASRLVAERVGLKPDYRIIKHYYGMDMPHIVYALER